MSSERKSGSGDRNRLFGELIASAPRRAGRATAAATATSVAFHAIAIAGAVWATLALGGEASLEEEQITLLKIVEDPQPNPLDRPLPPIRPDEPPVPAIAAPAPPEPEVSEPDPPEPVHPEAEAAEPEPEQEAAGFQTLAEPEAIPDEIPPSAGREIKEADFSGRGVEGGRAVGAAGVIPVRPRRDERPTHTPYTVAPKLLNPDEVIREARGLYPPLLREAGIEGEVKVWLFVDEKGRVKNSLVGQSSGREEFDRAALQVSRRMRFKPAENDDQKVAVWVVMPIRFSMRR
jgi:protein TonB